MAFDIRLLWKAPSVNPVNHKAKSIPALNPFNLYGRVFLLSWWGFFIAFWSWYAFPPLLTDTIKKDLRLSQNDIANSNILGLVATLLVRLGAGTACDKIGPRWTFAVILLTGAIPTALAGTITTPQGLIVIRFFVGILGGSFIPCQVWTTGFFDKNVVGTANSFAAGFGNAGSGVTYFVMPAIFNSLVQRQGLTEHVAWRVAFVVPFILITVTAVIMILACPDTPTGMWSSRTRDVQRHLDMRDTFFTTTGGDHKLQNAESIHSGGLANDTIKLNPPPRTQGRYTETQAVEDDLLTAASWELVEKPSVSNSTKAIASLPTWTLIAAYFCSFGTELSVNSILGAFYNHTFPTLGQTGSGNWAAMFGLLNFVFRPAGGIISDLIYRYTRSLWGKKMLIHSFGLMTGVFLMVIGFTNPGTKAMMFGLMTGLAFFEEAGNGACFSLVPHVHPTSNGLITGVTGAAGDLGGIIFLLIARYEGTKFHRVFWIIGVINIVGNAIVAWIQPIPKGQLGGR
ncbi:hypothetical protein MMC21_006965 [Puttea exsequens]|nr:hypothetical protein [Puttea exsequens]